MRSRSSRLFIVLLHLVGVSTNIPKRRGSHIGIVGVHPMSILLERLELEAFADGLDGLLKHAAEWNKNGGDELLLAEPYWLQDDVDGKCFGPAGFSECGDATLWLLRRRTRKKRRNFISRLLILGKDHESEKTWGYALQSVDAEMMTEPVVNGPSSRDREHRRREDCLLGELNARHRRKDLSLKMGRCSSIEAAWSWRINGKGVLYQDGATQKNDDNRKQQQNEEFSETTIPAMNYFCTWRTNETSATLAPCNPELEEEDFSHESMRLISFSLVRYQATAGIVTPPQPSSHVKKLLNSEHDRISIKQRAGEQQQEDLHTSSTVSTSENNRPNQMDIAHVHASNPVLHPELKPPNQLLFTRTRHLGDSSRETEGKTQFPLLLMNSNPSLFMERDEEDQELNISPPPRSGRTPRDDGASKPIRPRKIPTHPYIATCKNEVWTDPQTQLEFRTDLSGYLGDDRKAKGRHTLTGVGQYLRTVFNIKVYGVAFYVSKRDVLADPLFEQYSTLETEELQVMADFYSHLRHMPSKVDQNGGLFDRTILLKLNMQLSTETMRSSLQYDWKMLTDEHKNLLINSSLSPRPALESMLNKIKSGDNPGSCSCGQVAPEEYKADPTCCARGTELVFTWRKNGDLEVRVDGRVMDSFPQPGIAKGIFFEYLRFDDPISLDARDHIADGFPFLLAPLAQVKGMSSTGLPAGNVASSVSEEHGLVIVRAVSNIADMISSQAVGFTKWVQDGTNGMVSTVTNIAKNAGDSARNAGDEIERRRVLAWNHVVSLPEHGVNFVSSRMQEVADNARIRKDRKKNMCIIPKQRMRSSHRGRVFRSPMTRWLGNEPDVPLPDEIGSILKPTMNLTRTMFLCGVHLYLLLLLIVSLPDSYNTRTRLVVRKACSNRTSLVADSDSSSEEERDYIDVASPGELEDMKESRKSSSRRLMARSRNSISKGKRCNRIRASPDDASCGTENPKDTGTMKKSLSYFL